MATQIAQPPAPIRLGGKRRRLVYPDTPELIAAGLERFRAMCRFDAATGCVVWAGGTTRGRGNSATYGSFWYNGRRWFAHRWAAVYIHELDVSELTVGHCCPHTPDKHPNTLCVEHVEVQTLSENVAEGNTRRVLRARQSLAERQYWLLVERGYEPAPAVHDPATAADVVPFFTPPAWLANTGDPHGNDCPF